MSETLVNIPVPIPNFVGRKEQLKVLKNYGEDTLRKFISKFFIVQPKIIIVSGPSSQGKSQLVANSLMLNPPTRRNCVLLNSANIFTFLEDAKTYLKPICYVKQDDVFTVRGPGRQDWKNWLFILDNYDTKIDKVDKFIRLGIAKKAKFIILTLKDDMVLTNSKTIKLSGFNDQDAKALLCSFFNTQQQQEEEAIQEFFRLFKNQPLPLNLAGAYIQTKTESVPLYTIRNFLNDINLDKGKNTMISLLQMSLVAAREGTGCAQCLDILLSALVTLDYTTMPCNKFERLLQQYEFKHKADGSTLICPGFYKDALSMCSKLGLLCTDGSKICTTSCVRGIVKGLIDTKPVVSKILCTHLSKDKILRDDEFVQVCIKSADSIRVYWQLLLEILYAHIEIDLWEPFMQNVFTKTKQFFPPDDLIVHTMEVLKLVRKHWKREWKESTNKKSSLVLEKLNESRQIIPYSVLMELLLILNKHNSITDNQTNLIVYTTSVTIPCKAREMKETLIKRYRFESNEDKEKISSILLLNFPSKVKADFPELSCSWTQISILDALFRERRNRAEAMDLFQQSVFCLESKHGQKSRQVAMHHLEWGYLLLRKAKTFSKCNEFEKLDLWTKKCLLESSKQLSIAIGILVLDCKFHEAPILFQAGKEMSSIMGLLNIKGDAYDKLKEDVAADEKDWEDDHIRPSACPLYYENPRRGSSKSGFLSGIVRGTGNVLMDSLWD